MKFLRFACVCVLCASPIFVHGAVVNGIDMLSQSYSISASWTENWNWIPPEQITAQPYPFGDWCAGPGYNTTEFPVIHGGYGSSTSDGSPVARSTGSPSPFGSSPLSAGASIDWFLVHNLVSSIRTGPAGGGPAPIGGFAFYGGSIQTSVQGNWFFRPVGSSIDVNINTSFSNQYGPGYAGLTATLIDTTPGHNSTLLNLVNANLNSHYTFAVNPSDVYELTVSGWSNTFDDDYAVENFTASIMSVPEPSALSLLTIGMAGLGFVRSGRRRGRKSSSEQIKRVHRRCVPSSRSGGGR